jgi:hypothetical protein
VLSIAAAWASFEQAVLTDAPPIQRRQMRRAFYAGARELLNTILAMLDPGLNETEADLSRMDALNDELERFAVDLAEGRA